MRSLSLKRLGMARVNKGSHNGSHSFTSHPHVYTQVEWAIPAFNPQPQSVSTLEGRRLSWPGSLGEIPRWFAHLKTVTHASTNWARHRVTSLKCPTTLPLCQTASKRSGWK